MMLIDMRFIINFNWRKNSTT